MNHIEVALRHKQCEGCIVESCVGATRTIPKFTVWKRYDNVSELITVTRIHLT
jgi:hypothetical protein